MSLSLFARITGVVYINKDFQNGFICGLSLFGLPIGVGGVDTTIYKQITDALAKKMYYADSVTLKGILDCIATIAPALYIGIRHTEMLPNNLPAPELSYCIQAGLPLALPTGELMNFLPEVNTQVSIVLG